MRRIMLVAVAVLLAGCQGTLPGKTASDLTPNAITGGAIEVTALDAPKEGAGKPDPAAAPKPDEAEPVAPKPAQEGQGAKPEPAVPAPAADAAPADAEAVPAPPPEAVTEPSVPKSDAQLACEKKRGRWSKIGKGELFACIYQTKDSGKRCERESQCESACLARSGTCAPFKPLFGCNEIFQDDGQRVTQCID